MQWASYLLLLMFIPILFISTPVLAHTHAFTTGFRVGITNENESQCNVYGNATGVNSAENDCRSAFEQGQLKLMQSTPQYQIGLMAGRHDSTIANSTGDAYECNVYTNIFQYNSCAKGFDATYHYEYKGPLPIIAATTVHCNANNNASNSCYHLGENDGIDAATALIKICHRSAPEEPRGHHSSQYVLGFKKGWQNANSASENDNASYGTNNCQE
ncbi:MAG: hypothetical protein WAK17_28270 [Candidatus Nitrosopolaris sp.]|jgi:hypothetical protein